MRQIGSCSYIQYNKKTILADLEVIKNILESFDCPAKELNALENLIMSIENDNGSIVVNHTLMDEASSSQPVVVQNDDINVGSIAKII